MEKVVKNVRWYQEVQREENEEATWKGKDISSGGWKGRVVKHGRKGCVVKRGRNESWISQHGRQQRKGREVMQKLKWATNMHPAGYHLMKPARA